MTQFASDSFTGTEGDELTAYSSDWLNGPAYTGKMEISANRSRQASTASSLYRHATAPASADYSVSADLFAKTTAPDNSVGVVGRASASAATFYHARYGGTSTQKWQLYKIVNGSFTLLGDSYQILVDETSYNVKLDMTGTAIKLFKENEGTAVVSVTDSAITAAGAAGLRSYTGTAITDTSGMHADNFSADDGAATATLGTITETSTLQPLSASQSQEVGVVSEAGSLQALSASQSQTLGTITESGSLQPLAASQSTTVGQITEAGSLQSLTAGQSATVGQIAETGTVQALSASQSQTLGTITESGSLQPLAASQSTTVGQITESGSVQALLSTTDTLGTITETSTLQPLSASQSQEVGVVSESSSLQTLSASQSQSLGTTTETSTVQTLSASQSQTLGAIAETSTVQTLSASQSQILATITETGTTLPVSTSQSQVLGDITELGSLQPLIDDALFTLGMITETGLVLPLNLDAGLYRYTLPASAALSRSPVPAPPLRRNRRWLATPLSSTLTRSS